MRPPCQAHQLAEMQALPMHAAIPRKSNASSYAHQQYSFHHEIPMRGFEAKPKQATARIPA